MLSEFIMAKIISEAIIDVAFWCIGGYYVA